LCEFDPSPRIASQIPDVRGGAKTGKAQIEHKISALPPIVLQNSSLRCDRAIIESD